MARQFCYLSVLTVSEEAFVVSVPNCFNGLGDGKRSISEKSVQTSTAVDATVIHRLLGRKISRVKYRTDKHNPDNNKIIIKVMTFNQTVLFPDAIKKIMNNIKSTTSAIVILRSISLYLLGRFDIIIPPFEKYNILRQKLQSF